MRMIASRRRLRDRIRRSPALLVAVAVGLLVLAAAVTPDGLFLVESDERDRIVLPATPGVLRYLAVTAAVVLIVMLVVLRATLLRGQEEKKSGSSRYRWLALAFVLLALWVTFTSWRQEPVAGRDGAREIQETTEPQQRLGRDEQRPTREFSETFGWVVVGVFVLALTGVIAAMVVLFRPEAAADDMRTHRNDLLDTVEAGVDDLRAIEDPRAAVIACYSRMQVLTDMVGIDRRAADTPFELLAKVLEHHDVSEHSARRLTQLFEEAKFSTRHIDEDMRQQALDALLEVRSELGAVPA
jgi:hypothetical protein